MAKTYLATLDANGKIPSSQLPSYVDDVLEYSSKASFPTTGEKSKIYVDTTSNLTYRWGGSGYAPLTLFPKEDKIDRKFWHLKTEQEIGICRGNS